MRNPVFLRIALFALAALLMACPGGRNKTDDALSFARDALAAAADAQPCAEAEYAAAQRLLEQAEQAAANKEWAEARQLADAAVAQAQRARDYAAANAEDCARRRQAVEVVEEVAENTQNNNNANAAYIFVPVYFDYNESTLTAAGRRVVAEHAAVLQQRPNARVTIEGHCDSRGSEEYNLALGEKRARAAKAYLVELGIAESRVSTISFGAEFPAGSDYDLNRRAEFRVRDGR